MPRRLLAAGGAVLALSLAAVAVAAYAGRGQAERAACGEVGDSQRVVSPDGRRSALVRCAADGSAWLYVAGRGGAGARRLAPRRYNCCYRPSASVLFRDPAWSPDGRRIAVVIEDVGGTDLWVMDATGRSARRVTSGPAREGAPRWSADGGRITFSTETAGTLTVPIGVAEEPIGWVLPALAAAGGDFDPES